MPIKVQLTDGRTVEFPDGTSEQEMEAALTQLPPPDDAPATAPSAPAKGLLPTAGGFVGSLIGTVGGYPGRVAGAAAGGALGKGAEMLMDDKSQGFSEGLRAMGGEAMLQGGAEAAGGVIGKGIKAAAPRLMQSVMKPTKAIRDEFPTVAKDAVEYGIGVGQKGLDKVGTLISGTSQKVMDKLSLAQRAGARPIAMSDVTTELAPVAQKIAKEPISAGKLSQLNDIGNQARLENPGPISLLRAQEMKQAAQRVAGEGYKKIARGADINTIPLDANMAIARGLRKEIEKRANVGPLNAETQRLMGVERAMDAAQGRISNNQPIGMNALIASGVGAGAYGASGDSGTGGMTAATVLALTNPWLASRLAIGMDRAAPLATFAPQAARAALLAQLGMGDE